MARPRVSNVLNLPRLASLLAILSLLPAAPAAEAGRQDQPEQFRARAAADLGRYHAMLDAYKQGDERASLEEITSWSVDRLRAALARAHTADDAFKPWSDRRFCLAALLHTDLALLRLQDPEFSMSHLDIAAGMLETGARNGHALVRSFAPRWFQAVSQALRDREGPYIADRLLSRARRWLGDDALVLYESGTLAESLATDYALAGISNGPRGRDAERVALTPLMERRTRHLNNAARWLRDALQIRPHDSAIQLRLGRVEALRLKDDEALRLLKPLVSTGDSSVAYLANLFSAAIHERRSRFGEAAAAYRLAIHRVPAGHAANLGLSAVLAQMGDVEGARRSAIGYLSRTEPQAEPLWNYRLEPASLIEERLNTLRREVRR